MIDTIIFDLSEVQLTGLVGVEKRLAPLLGVKEEEVLKRLSGEDLLSFFHGQLKEEDYLSRVIKKNRWEISNDKLGQIIRENFKEIKGTRAIIGELRLAGYKLGLLSVHGKEWIEYISKKFDYETLFHSVSYSYEVSISKPDRMAYQILLDKLVSKSENSVFIDDSENNLRPARELGMKTILFTNAIELRRSLIDLKILSNRL